MCTYLIRFRVFLADENDKMFPATGEVSDIGDRSARGYTMNLPIPCGALGVDVFFVEICRFVCVHASVHLMCVREYIGYRAFEPSESGTKSKVAKVCDLVCEGSAGSVMSALACLADAPSLTHGRLAHAASEPLAMQLIARRFPLSALQETGEVICNITDAIPCGACEAVYGLVWLFSR